MVAWRGNNVVSTQPTVAPLNFMEGFVALSPTSLLMSMKTWAEG